MESGAASHMQHLDLNTCDLLNEPILTEFIDRHGHQLRGLNLVCSPSSSSYIRFVGMSKSLRLKGGHHKLTENFWNHAIPNIRNVKTLVMGIAVNMCANVQSKIHVDHFMDEICRSCRNIERLEMRWDAENLRFSDKSGKFVDMIRMKCLKLKSLVLSDGEVSSSLSALS